MSEQREDVVTLAAGTSDEVRVYVVIEREGVRLVVVPEASGLRGLSVMPVTRTELLGLRTIVNRAIDTLGAGPS